MEFKNLNSFYKNNLGKSVEKLLQQKINSYIGNKNNKVIMGIGYTEKYLKHFQDNRCVTLSLIPSFIDNFYCNKNNINVVCEEDHLPISNDSCDVFLLLHCLEHASSPWGLMAEINRILPSGGRIIVVVPNRVGLWARRSNNPFGSGRSYTKGQLKKLLNSTGFFELEIDYNIYYPPINNFFNNKLFSLCEKFLKYILRENSGVIIGMYEKRVCKRAKAKKRMFKIPLLKPNIALNKNYIIKN